MMTTRRRASVVQQAPNHFRGVLDECVAPNGATLSQELVSAKKRRVYCELFHESGEITDGQLAQAYVREDAAKGGFVAANDPAGAAASAPPWFGPAMAQALAPVNARLDGVETRLDGIEADIYNSNARIYNSGRTVDDSLRALKNSSKQLPSSQQLHFPTTHRNLNQLAESGVDALLDFYNLPLNGTVDEKRTNLFAFVVTG